MRYFFRWKLISQLDMQVYQRYIMRTVKFRYLIKLSKDRYLKRIKDAFYLWYFQTKQGFPFYHKQQQDKLDILERIQKIKAILEKKTTKKSQFHFHELYLTIEKLVTPVEREFMGNKSQVMRQFKCLFQIEQIVIRSQQSILIRTLSVNMELYFNSFRKGQSTFKKDIGPRELLNIMEDAYVKKSIKMNHEADYLEKFYTKLEIAKTRVRDSEILVTGIWASPNPLFRLREYIFVKLVQRTYIKWINVALIKLRFNKHLLELKHRERTRMEQKNTSFKKTWGRIFLAYSLLSKIEKINSDVLISYEFLKKKQEIDNTKAEIPPNLYQKQLMQIQEVPDYEEMIRESFKKRLAETKKVFAKRFLSVILKPGDKTKEVKKELMSLLVDTLYYVTCGTLQSVNTTPRDKLS